MSSTFYQRRLMSIWSTDYHLRHPWFDIQVMKRKHFQESTSSEESDVSEQRATKRRRCSVLERGFAHLSLQHKPQDLLQKEETRDQGLTVSELSLPSDHAMDADDEADGVEGHTEPIMLPSHIEEPEQDIPEIQMKTSSWYELSPHRIVITDLDSSESEDEAVGNAGSVTINTPLLEHIKKQTLLIPPERISQALVLYRPLSSPLQGPEEKPCAMNAEAMEVET